MRRVFSWVCPVGLLATLLTSGCQTADGHRWTMPWQKPMAKEEYTIPPLADSRYSEPQSLPKTAMRSGLPEKRTADPMRPSTGPMTAGMPGSMGRPGGGY
jgi:hypothetical protein